MDLKRLVEISPAIGTFLIFIGFTKLYLYFNHWDISIINYLDFSEIILSFLNDLNIFIFFIVLLLIQMTIGISAIFAVIKIVNWYRKCKVNKARKKLKPYEIVEQHIPINTPTLSDLDNIGIIPVIPVTIITLILTFIFAVLFFYFAHMSFLYLTYVFFIQLTLMLFLEVLKIENMNTVSQLTIGTLLITFSLCITYYDIKQTEKGVTTVGLLLNSNEVIISDNDLKFLGKTNNYYFFFDDSKKLSVIYPASSVLKVIQTRK